MPQANHFILWDVVGQQQLQKVWSSADLQWIEEMDCLLTRIFGADTPVYETDKHR